MPVARFGATATAPAYFTPPTAVDVGEDWASFGVPGTIITLARDEPLFFEGDAADCYFRVLSGAVRSCTVLADGRRHIGDFFLPGDFLGLGAIGRYRHTVEAVGEARVASYARRSVDLLVDERPSLGRWLLAVACNKLAAADRHKLLLGRKSAQEKIASFIIHMVRRDPGSDRVKLPMTRTDIGDYLGLTTETVSRTFTQLRTEGIIVLKGINELCILDWNALDGIAGEI
jgi:CRP/FNR family transcriptional regulator